MADQTIASRIMSKPLPQILDEIDDSIRLADAAAKTARDAAAAAQLAGEKAAGEAARVAAEHIAKVQAIADEALALAKQIRAALQESSSSLQDKLASTPAKK
ncbi:hypothetical protein ABFB09_03815 [Dehalogenimonas sp. THU2]|uniref:hypothetical protein n=1 Tax=Dehalogenimonas sp. THU2 TaxID=3151121 RepID=UPI003218575C